MKLGNIEIADWRMNILCKASYLECLKFYEDPENMKRFEAWKAARDEEAARKGAQA